MESNYDLDISVSSGYGLLKHIKQPNGVSRPCQTSKMKLFAKVGNVCQLLSFKPPSYVLNRIPNTSLQSPRQKLLHAQG